MQPMKPIKVLILYGNYGAGHKRAAEALSEVISQKIPHSNVVCEDFLGQAFPVADWIVRKMYLQTFYWAKSIYGFLYYKTKDLPADTKLFQPISYLGSWKLEQYLLAHQPDLVISTFNGLTGMLAKVKERGRFDFTLWCVITDYVHHSNWLYKAVDQYFVASDALHKELTRAGIDPSTIVTTGIPIMQGFYKKQPKESLLTKWGLHDTMPVVLISSGAFGVTDLSKTCKQLLQTNPRTQFVVICGKNKKLYQRLIRFRNAGYKTLHPLPFVKEMDELMQIADLFVTKAGGLSVSEAIAAQVPMVIVNSLPGQETENAKMLIQANVARYVERYKDLADIIHEIMEDPKQLVTMQSNFEKIRLPFSPAAKIAEMVDETFANEFITSPRLYLNNVIASASEMI